MFAHSLTFAVALAIVSNSPTDKTQPPTDPAAKIKAAPVDDVADITGYFVCKGQEAGGKKYTGIAVIAKKSDIYLVQWMVGAGSSFSGIGIRQGNTLAVSWTLPSERGTVRGVNLYRIEPGPRLTGRWATVPGPGVLQSETLTFLKALEEEE